MTIAELERVQEKLEEIRGDLKTQLREVEAQICEIAIDLTNRRAHAAAH